MQWFILIALGIKTSRTSLHFEGIYNDDRIPVKKRRSHGMITSRDSWPCRPCDPMFVRHRRYPPPIQIAVAKSVRKGTSHLKATSHLISTSGKMGVHKSLNGLQAALRDDPVWPQTWRAEDLVRTFLSLAALLVTSNSYQTKRSLRFYFCPTSSLLESIEAEVACIRLNHLGKRSTAPSTLEVVVYNAN